MITSQYSKQDLLKSFLPLSDSGKAFLEIMLVNPKSSTIEGRGFFNDTDFLLEACNPQFGRYNFCISNFAYAADQIPTRNSYNQFDRAYLDAGLQEHARAHSLSLVVFFKPDLIREISSQSGNSDYLMNVVYQVDDILGRLKVKSYCLDYFLTGLVLRFNPSALLQRRPLNKSALAVVSKRMLEVIEKEMTPQEHKRFALGSAATGKVWDPLPGLPGFFTGDGQESVIVTSSGGLQPAEEMLFLEIFEEIFEGRKQKGQESVYTSPNIQGLSQNWEASHDEGGGGRGLQVDKGYSESKAPYTDAKSREGSPELASFFQATAAGKWRWPLYATLFNKAHQGVACGDLLFLQCDPFAAELGFHYLMQCAEAYTKEGTGQMLVFTKKRGSGDLALASLSRHYKTNPFLSKQPGKFPDPAALAKVYGSLFPHPPQVISCGHNEGLEQVLKYLEHDYLLKQKKSGHPMMPLAILIDNLDEFFQESEMETFKRLSQLKLKLREINGSLWVTQAAQAGAAPRLYLGLADLLLWLDHDGSQEAAAAGRPGAPRPGEWEAQFHLDLSMGEIVHDISLIRIGFQVHGSHRPLPCHYVYYRSSCLFREIQTPARQPSSP